MFKRKNDILLIRFRLLTMQRKLTYTKLFTLSAPQKMPNVTATVAYNVPSKKTKLSKFLF